MVEPISESSNATVVLADGTTITGVRAAVYPGWVRVRTDDVNQFYPREQVREVKTGR
ncbi:hypothetical protein [Halomicrococcus sp. SG-WS-1]|uniref:hypothetical protein n=1 Tax=Halomicrococcus sp. SG-WS-1 TaxID=3439057 RepID=UPI003F78DC0A